MKIVPQIKPFCTPIQIAEFKMEVAIALQSFSQRRLLLFMGMCNSYAWRIAADWGVIKEECGKWKVCDSEGMRKLAVACHEGKGTLHNALTSLQQYISNFWGHACKNIKTIRSMRSLLKGMGLFNFEEIETKAVIKKGKLYRTPVEATVATPEITEVNFLKLLLAYQVADRLFKSKIRETACVERDYTPQELNQEGGDVTFNGWDKGLQKRDCMPHHGGALMIEMFNHCFTRQYHEFNDDIIFAGVKGEIEVPVVGAIAYKWKKSFGLKLKKWAEIHHRKFGNFGSFFLDCVFGEEEDNSLVDVPY